MTSHNLGARGVVPPGMVKFGMVANFMLRLTILLMPYTPVTDVITKVPEHQHILLNVFPEN